MVVERDCGLNTMYNNYGFSSQQRVLNIFPSLGYLQFKDGWDNLNIVSLGKYAHIYIHIYIYIYM